MDKDLGGGWVFAHRVIDGNVNNRFKEIAWFDHTVELYLSVGDQYRQ